MRTSFAFADRIRPAPRIGLIFFAFSLIWMAGTAWLMWPTPSDQPPKSWPTVRLPPGPNYDVGLLWGVDDTCPKMSTSGPGCVENYGPVRRAHPGFLRYISFAQTQRQDWNFVAVALGVPIALAMAALGILGLRRVLGHAGARAY
jgi:hypothetical protein